MSADNTQEDLNKGRYLKVRAAFVGQGTTLNAWCRENGLHLQNVRDAFAGKWRGVAASAIIQRVIAAAGVAE